MKLNFEKFKKDFSLSLEDISREYFIRNKDNMSIKKESTAIKNLATIIQTTLSISNDRGFQAMSLRDLSKESGLSLGALYSYFSSKEELFRIIHNIGMDTITNVLVQIIAHCNTLDEKLRHGIKIHLYLSELMGDWFYFLYMETKNLSKEERKLSLQAELYTENIFAEIIQEGIKKKIFQTKNALLISSAIKALLQDWYLKRWKYLSRKITVEEYAEFVIEFVEANLLKNKK